MASMTDVVFLLLVFFMVTSTFIFPTALEVNLPQSTEHLTLVPYVGGRKRSEAENIVIR